MVWNYSLKSWWGLNFYLLDRWGFETFLRIFWNASTPLQVIINDSSLTPPCIQIARAFCTSEFESSFVRQLRLPSHQLCNFMCQSRAYTYKTNKEAWIASKFGFISSLAVLFIRLRQSHYELRKTASDQRPISTQKILSMEWNFIYFKTVWFRACSHEPGTVNYPWVMIAPGQALPRVHMMICCPGSTSFPRGKFIVIWSLRIYLNSFSFYTNCCREWILNMFTYFWCFLELFIEKFILNINNEHAQDYSCPGATFAFCSHGEKLPRQGGLPGVVQRVFPPLEDAPGQRKTHVNSHRRQTMHRGKVDPVSELPRGNELSRDHVNRP